MMSSQSCFRVLLPMAVSLALPLAARADPSDQDKKFISEAGSGGMLEVRLGQYASNNAASDEVKKFAEHMVDDHTKGHDQLTTLATQQPIDIPKELSEDDKKLLDQLETTTGDSFDKAYMAAMVKDHKHDIAEFEKEISEGSDPSIKAFAEKMLPILKHHLKMAEELSK